jgi:hypothetical protein
MKYSFTEIIFLIASITVVMRYFLCVDTDPGFCNVPNCVILIVTWNEGESGFNSLSLFRVSLFLIFLFSVFTSVNLIDYK